MAGTNACSPKAPDSWRATSKPAVSRPLLAATINDLINPRPRIYRRGSHPYQTRSRASLLHARLLSQARGIRGSAQSPGDEAERRYRARQSVWPEGARWCRIPSGPEVAVRPEGHAETQI